MFSEKLNIKAIKFRLSAECKAISNIADGNNHIFILFDAFNVLNISINEIFIKIFCNEIHRIHSTE
jgi:hypothetical protein